jgi:hypothetical protein
MMSIYGEPTDRSWFEKQWAKAGKKLNAGKCCIRFKGLEDLALDVIAEAVRRMPAKKYIRYCESALAKNKADSKQRSEARRMAKKPKQPESAARKRTARSR